MIKIIIIVCDFNNYFNHACFILLFLFYIRFKMKKAHRENDELLYLLLYRGPVISLFT